ncbi:hypothetical protein TD95_003230 [Thielaviopsis punctulata]|uniref:Uncharacterized protein n=1 Tax=Thielaviopsis punctulata TaxID=72032 RepID=A0A0F4ZDB9_9PEZI|nr:hypothetical protein TD95_003230 [Thielaviopsis punctulata]
MEGMLMVPPERGQILGRAVWKNRYVVCGKREANAAIPQTPGFGKSQNSKEIMRIVSDDLYLCLYKNKGDTEAVFQCPISQIIDCQVQMVAHRKQGPALPTLVINVVDKERKRRSSRAASLINGNKDSSTSISLLFRTTPEDKQPLLHEWSRFIMSRKSPMSPDTPTSPTFSNPFGSRNELTRPNSGSHVNPMPTTHKGSVTTQGSRERAVTYSSDSPSLRSKTSDLSTPSSIAHGFTSYNQPFSPSASDFPSPATTMDDYKGEFIEGWTASKGRSSMVNSPIYHRESLDQRPSLWDCNSPPVPGETILDRAFNMRVVPGSERMLPGEEKLSSITRFDALMREVDTQRRMTKTDGVRPNMDDILADDNDRDDDDSRDNASSSANNSMRSAKRIAPKPPRISTNIVPKHTSISPAAQRALDFIASRHDEPDLCSPISPTSQFPEMPAGGAKTRPQTTFADRRQSEIFMDTNSIAMSLNATVASSSASVSAKRLSFSEFTKRLSNTSSLLLVQSNTNTSTGTGNTTSSDSKASTELGLGESCVGDDATSIHSSLSVRHQQAPMVPPPRPPRRADTVSECGSFRGGFVPTDGGFF